MKNHNDMSTEQLIMHYILKSIEYKKKEEECRKSGKKAESREYKKARTVLKNRIDKLDTICGTKSGSREFAVMK